MNRDEFRGRVLAKLKGRSKLATLVGVVRKVEMIVRDGDASAHELSDVIKADAVLTAKMLQVVNSAVMSKGRKIEDIDQAVVVLGFERVRAICAGLMSGAAVQTGSSGGFSMCELWCHSVATAAGAEYLYDRLGGDHDKEPVSLAGLLCNIGRIIIFEWFHEESVQILARMHGDGITMYDAERALLGVTHAEVGFWAAEHWGLDEKVCHIILHHHGPMTSRDTDLVNLAYVSAQAKLAGSPGEERIVHLIPGLLGRLGLDEASLDDVLRQLDGVYLSLGPVFEMMRSG